MAHCFAHYPSKCIIYFFNKHSYPYSLVEPIYAYKIPSSHKIPTTHNKKLRNNCTINYLLTYIHILYGFVHMWYIMNIRSENWGEKIDLNGDFQLVVKATINNIKRLVQINSSMNYWKSRKLDLKKLAIYYCAKVLSHSTSERFVPIQ